VIHTQLRFDGDGCCVSNSVSDDHKVVSSVRPKRRFGKILLVGGSGLVLVALLVGYLSYRESQTVVDRLLVNPARDYTRMPFNMMDATEYCRLRTQRRYGNDLVLSYVDENSTRIDVKTGLYKIFMFVHVGNPRNYEEEAIHCFVDPQSRVLTHYRAISLRKASLMEKASKLLELF
jgi:hypothetical protein